MTDKIVVFSTCASEEEAEKLARLVVEQGLAACASIVPNVRSYYRWQGAVETAGEYLLVIKSARRQFAALSAAIERAHSYEVPEVLAVPVWRRRPLTLPGLRRALAAKRRYASQ